MTGHPVNWNQRHNFLDDEFMKLFSMVAQIVGLIAVTAGVSLIFLPAGLIVGGACLVLIGFAFGMDK